MNMKVRRTEKLKTDLFHVGDVICFRLTTGEKVEMLAVKSEFDGMIFCFVDCLAAEYRMKIGSKLVPFENGDYIRIPTEKEVFGENEYGEDEPDGVEQWKPMKWRRNRIAFQGLNGAWEWYWLQNPAANSAAGFALVYSNGLADCAGASNAYGVRPVVKIRNPASAPACRVPVKGEREW